MELGCTYDLWKVQGVIADCVEDKILKLIDNVEKVLSKAGHDAQRYARDAQSR